MCGFQWNWNLVQNLCSQHVTLSSTVKNPDVLYVHFFMALHTLLHNSLHCLWTRESKEKKINLKSFIICVTFSIKYVENSVLLLHPLCYWVTPLGIQKTRSKSWTFVISLQALTVLETGAATREHVSICISALGFFLITVCLMNLLHNLWSRCQNSFAWS